MDRPSSMGRNPPHLTGLPTRQSEDYIQEGLCFQRNAGERNAGEPMPTCRSWACGRTRVRADTWHAGGNGIPAEGEVAIPALCVWGMVAMMLLMLTTGTIVLGRHVSRCERCRGRFS